jgi:hypothetical protein
MNELMQFCFKTKGRFLITLGCTLLVLSFVAPVPEGNVMLVMGLLSSCIGVIVALWNMDCWNDN